MAETETKEKPRSASWGCPQIVDT